MSVTATTDAARDPQHIDGATDTLLRVLNEIEARATSQTSASLAAERDTSDAAERDEASEAGQRAQLGDLINALDERAFGFLLLLLALPCCLPFVYLLPQIVALPMLALAAQLAMGRAHPWLPGALHRRSFDIVSFKNVLGRSQKYVGWFERLARPRLTFLTDKTGARVVGLIMLIPTASILLPLPSTNTVPGIGVAIAALGLIERDGLLVLLGLIVGLLWVCLLVFLGAEAASIIKDWLSALF